MASNISRHNDISLYSSTTLTESYQNAQPPARFQIEPNIGPFLYYPSPPVDVFAELEGITPEQWEQVLEFKDDERSFHMDMLCASIVLSVFLFSSATYIEGSFLKYGAFVLLSVSTVGICAMLMFRYKTLLDECTDIRKRLWVGTPNTNVTEIV